MLENKGNEGDMDKLLAWFQDLHIPNLYVSYDNHFTIIRYLLSYYPMD
jgi:hypothetical protein